MKKQEFLDKLRASLWALSEEEKKSSLEYYTEMIDDRMEDGLSEEEAVAAVGDLDEIVQQILSETPRLPAEVKKEEEQKKQKRKVSWWESVLLVLGFPVWGALLIAVSTVVFSVWIGLWSVVIALYATAFALAVSAIGLLMAAFSLLWIRHFAKGTVLVGGALVCAGLAVLIFLLSNLAAKGLAALTRLIWNGATGIFKRKERSA